MVRSLWSAASDMIAQQTNLDTISNNLANVNTTGYKTDVAEFKSLLYQTMQTKTTTANGQNKPVGAQVGLGVRNSSINSMFTQGNMLESTSTSAFGIEGKGFFAVRGEDGQTYYTRNGNFLWATDNGNITLTTTAGLPVLDSNGNKISFNSSQYMTSSITITGDGEICYPNATNNAQSLGIKIGLYQFQNPSGLEKMDSSLYAVSAASGQAMNEAVTAGLTQSQVNQGYLEGSNVQVVDKMVNMIVAQRAYEMNSKAIQATDEMMSQANNLRR